VSSMSWLSRLNPRGPGSRSARSAAPSSPCIADPETCLMVFENHWRQVSWVLEQREPSSSSDDLIAVRNHTDQMLCLLAEERSAEGSDSGTSLPPMGPILQLVVTENIIERLVQWHLHRGLDPDSQGALLKLFEMLIGQSQQPLLQQTAILHPLLRLLGACSDPELGCPSVLENSLVLLLNQVCVSMARQPVVLEMLFRVAPAQQGSTNLLIFSLLVPFIHRDGAIGQQARDALLLVMATSASHEAVACYIAEHSYFCPVLATGLSALYSSLPRKIEVRGDDWHALRREDWMCVSSLVLFMNSLEFCNAVVQVAHPLVRSQLLDYLHNGFLVPVMGPALHKSSVDEMIASTAYLDLFLRSVTETSLLKTFLRFILLHRHDNDTILDTLLTRISSNSRLCMVSLSLFRTLLSLHCEDIMLQLILRYLLPCTHVMLSQRRAIREIDIYGKSADKFLSLIPECCRLNVASSAERDEDSASWGKGEQQTRMEQKRLLNSPSTESPAPPRPSTPSRLAFFIRQQSIAGGSGVGGPSTPTSMEPLQSGPSSSHSLSPDSPFMVVLFAKLENMLQNSLYVNILLTGIMAKLACYPQPLLRSFLLNTNMVFQPSVKSLIQVLGSVKNRIEAFAASHEDFPAMLKKAQQYLVARGKVDWSDSMAAVPPLRRSDSLVKSRKPSLGDLILRHTNSPTRARHAAQLALAHVRDSGQSLHSALFKGGGGASGLEKQAEALRVKNAVYCAVIFCEFLKELAALAQEHAVSLPFPRSQEHDKTAVPNLSGTSNK
uniref:FHF complex subunit HOOK-interacting protein 1B n=1 Tax=Monopterus albus TaxID=43700 RepID=A0A3Q3J1G0_MONAL